MGESICDNQTISLTDTSGISKSTSKTPASNTPTFGSVRDVASRRCKPNIALFTRRRRGKSGARRDIGGRSRCCSCGTRGLIFCRCRHFHFGDSSSLLNEPIERPTLGYSCAVRRARSDGRHLCVSRQGIVKRNVRGIWAVGMQWHFAIDDSLGMRTWLQTISEIMHSGTTRSYTMFRVSRHI
jgi:hypothetical protein